MTIVLAIGGGYIALVLIMFLFQNSMIFFPDRTVAYDPSVYELPWEDARFHTDDGLELHGWYVPHPESDKVLLFSHGNAGNISHRIGFLDMLHGEGHSVFIYDYRGYGNSEGSPDEEGVYRDVRAAWDYLIREKEYDDGDIILFGRSLGGTVSAHLAASVQPAALILESSFTRAKDVASDIYPFIPSFIIRPELATADYLQNVNCPVLIMHSRDDSIIGFHHGERLYRAASEPKQFVELRGGHNDNFMVSGELYFDALKEFVSGHESGASPK